MGFEIINNLEAYREMLNCFRTTVNGSNFKVIHAGATVELEVYGNMISLPGERKHRKNKICSSDLDVIEEANYQASRPRYTPERGRRQRANINTKDLRRKINHNFSSATSQFITLTLKEQSHNLALFKKICQSLLRKLRRNVPGVKYIGAPGMGENGNYHLHLLVDRKLPVLPEEARPYIESGIIRSKKGAWRSMWSAGYVHVDPIDDDGNLGAFIASYLIKNANQLNVKNAHTFYRSDNLEPYIEMRDINGIEYFQHHVMDAKVLMFNRISNQLQIHLLPTGAGECKSLTYLVKGRINNRGIRVEASPVLKIVEFDLPFLTFGKDGLRDLELEKWAEGYKAGKRPLPYARYAPKEDECSGLIIMGGLPVYIPPQEMNPPYAVSFPGMQPGLIFLKRVNPHRPTKILGEVPGDRTGRATFSSVQVLIKLEQIKEEHHWAMEPFVEVAVNTVNRFLEHYKVICKRPYIRPVTPAVIQEFRVGTGLSDGQTKWQEFSTGTGPAIGLGGAIGDDEDKQLREVLLKFEPPPVEDMLDIEIIDHLDLREWRLAVIESAVLFEAWLIRFLRDYLKNTGISQADIDSKFVNTSGIPHSITRVATRTLKNETGFNFQITTEYNDWSLKVRDPRNEIVHGKRFDVGRDDAYAAYNSSKAASKQTSDRLLISQTVAAYAGQQRL